MELIRNETESVVNYINDLSHLSSRSNMTIIGDHTYIVGKHILAKPTSKQIQLLDPPTSRPIEVFFRLMKDRK